MRNGGSGGETTAAATKKMVAPFKLPEMALRLCVIPLTLASLWEMVTNKQTDDAYGEVKFSDLSGFKGHGLCLGCRLGCLKESEAPLVGQRRHGQAGGPLSPVPLSFAQASSYLVCINAITAAYSLASILLSSFKSLSHYDWLFFLMDQVAAYLLVTSGSAAAEVLYLAREGDREVYWSEVCSYFGRFCGRATVSVALHAAALLCFVALSLISAFRVFSKCDAPGAAADCSESKHAEEQGK